MSVNKIVISPFFMLIEGWAKELYKYISEED